MSAAIIIGILAAMGGGVWAVSRKKDRRFELQYPKAYRGEIESAFALAMDKLAPLGHKKRGTVRVVVRQGNERYGKRWGYKKPNGNLVGATTTYHPASGNQIVTIYTDPSGYEEPDEILHEMGHVVLNFDRDMAREPANHQHNIMRTHGIPLC